MVIAQRSLEPRLYLVRHVSSGIVGVAHSPTRPLGRRMSGSGSRRHLLIGTDRLQQSIADHRQGWPEERWLAAED
jgi:hypothetical protein